MGRVDRLVLSFGLVASLGIAIGGCQVSGVGDPCMPEEIPDDGFNAQESYVEASSVQCRTRTCIVQGLSGDPRDVFYGVDDPRNTCTPGIDANCHTPEEVDDHVYCSCRCSAPAGSSTPTCDCPSGFTCEDLLELGGPGIRGGYCVKNEVTPTGDGG